MFREVKLFEFLEESDQLFELVVGGEAEGYGAFAAVGTREFDAGREVAGQVSGKEVIFSGPFLLYGRGGGLFRNRTCGIELADHLLDASDRQTFAHYQIEKLQLLFRVGDGEQGAGVAHLQLMVSQSELDFSGEFEETQMVGYGGNDGWFQRQACKSVH